MRGLILSSKNVLSFLIESDGVFPNCLPHNLPLIIYKQAIDFSQVASIPDSIEDLLRSNSVVPQWRFSVYKRPHYHANTHEILAPFIGSATLRFGGPTKNGIEVDVQIGDLVLIPAGVAHNCVKCSHDFCAVGGYPKGSENWDIFYGEGIDELKTSIEKIQSVRPLKIDPVFEENGPVTYLWK